MTDQKTEEFIKKAREVHGDKYDYSHVSYKSSNQKIEIICPKHGSFLQTPKNHLNNHGCPQCAIDKVKEKCGIEFEYKARKIHGDKYDYSKVVYVDSVTPVCIICPNHGEFMQTPRSHFLGKGCLECSYDKFRLTTEDFIERSIKVHGDKYDYSKTEYVNSYSKVCIICPKHGEFFQRAQAHMDGHGCPKCSKGCTEIMVEQAINVHGDKYDYSKVEYVNNKTHVVIICPEHGEFKQTPKDHVLKEYECPKCHPHYSKGEKEIVEFIRGIYSGEVLENVRNVISPKELDIYIPELKLAFEYNGLYYHSLKFNESPSDSRNKFIECEKQGIRLITIYEDEWQNKNDLVKSMISRYIGGFDRIFARQTKVCKIEKSSEYNNFLDENHIQGKCSANFAYGLYYNDELVSVMTFTLPRENMGRSKEKDSDKIELSRFCNKKWTSVVGGASKLLKAFTNSEEGKRFKEVYSYSDNRISHGNLYKSIGFTFEKDSSISYFYTNFKERKRKQSFRKSRLKEKGINIEGKTEVELAEEMGWFKIYDCGKKLWVLKTNKNEEN